MLQHMTGLFLLFAAHCLQLVQFVYARVNRMLLISQRYASKQYFALDFSGISPVTVPDNQYNPMSSILYNMLKNDYPELRLEYSAML
jgi:hypothetical protein